MLSNEIYCQFVDADTILFLVEQGIVCPKRKGNGGNTIVHLAFLTGNENVARSVLEVAKNDTDSLNIQNDDGDTPLHIAVRVFPRHSLLIELLDAGAATSIANGNGEIVELPSRYRQAGSSRQVQQNVNIIMMSDRPKEVDNNDIDEVFGRIDREMDSEKYPSWLSVESISPKNDLLMPF